MSVMEASPTEQPSDQPADRVCRFEDWFGRFEANEAQFDKMATKEQLNERMSEVNARFDRTDARLDRMDARFDMWGRIVAGGAISIAGTVIYKVLGL